MRDFFDPRVRTGARTHDYIHALITLALGVALIAVGFGAGYHTAQSRYTAAYWQAHYPAIPGFVAPGVGAPLRVLPGAFTATSGGINFTYWRVKTNNQSIVGGCQSWAADKLISFGYNSLTPHHSTFFSPRYYYDRASGGVDYGSYLDQYPPLYDQGGVRWAAFPYGPNRFGLPDYADDATIPAGVTIGVKSLSVTVAYLFQDAGAGLGGEQRIEQAILTGQPVNIDFPVYPEYDNANASNPYIGLPLPGEASRGGHANVIVGFRVDANGQVWFLVSNQWGGYWGGLDEHGQPSTSNGGYAWMSGAFVGAYGWDAATVSVS